MRTIDVGKQRGVSFILFPDNQPHVRISGISDGDDVRVICPIRSSLEMMHLLQVSNALDNVFAYKRELVIPYLMGARYDRVMQAGDSIDLKVVADLINSCGFEKVLLFDVHSEVALQLISRSQNVSNIALVQAYEKDNAVLICPDAGAVKKVTKYLEWNPRIKEVTYCFKKRDTDGHVKLKVVEPDVCTGRNCVVIDDICDGGATFMAIGDQIKPKHLTLIVSHGIFSRGFDDLGRYYQHIITTDSYANHPDAKGFVTTINLEGRFPLWI